MTTLIELAQERLREQRDGQRAQESEAEARRVRLDQECGEVLRLVKRDILMGAELPIGATIGSHLSNDHGHHVIVRFLPNLTISADKLYRVDGNDLNCAGWQKWTARHYPNNKQKTFDNFLDAATWLLDIKLEDES